MLNLLRGKSSASVEPAPARQSAGPSTDMEDQKRWKSIVGIPAAIRQSNSSRRSFANFGTPFTIYFGSQTGRTEALANRLHHAATREGLRSTVHDLYKFTPDEFLAQQVVVFVLATYAGGAPTDNAAHFSFWLQHVKAAKLGLKKNKVLQTVHFAVLGCGDATYADHFNEFATYVDRRLDELGGARLLPYRLGDVHGEFERTYREWEAALFGALKPPDSCSIARHSFLTTPAEKLPHGLAPRFAVIYVSIPCAPDFYKRRKESYLPLPAADDFFEPTNLVLDSVAYVLTEPKPPMLHVDFAMHVPPFLYTSADTLLVYPQNPPALVDAVASRLGFNLGNDPWIQLIPPDSFAAAIEATPLLDPFPSPCRLADCLARYYELATVDRALVATLAEYATNETERDRLAHLGDDATAFAATLGDRTLAGTLRLFPSVHVSLHVFLHIVPRMRPRPFTIASSNIVTPTNVHLCISVPPAIVFQDIDRSDGFVGAFIMELATKKTRRMSLTGNEPRNLEVNSRPTLFGTVVPSRVHPSHSTDPLVFVATGAGFAVVRAVLLDRYAEPHGLGRHLVFYGCRTKACMPYATEMGEWQTRLDIDVVLACSSDQAADDHEVKHRTVQEAVRAEAGALLQTLDEHHARIYVCGDATMVADVKEILLQAKQEQLTDVSSAKTAEWMLNLQQTGQYVESKCG
ncbi:Aste57867_2767 [Aphanomyces stellatus]|uniref:NADPH--hemoprotein reductase n=1 Tax=Aphanomyces stellatus TaxID=120398 RepID=A0A485KAS0_9STRA|nr:hypothetical protein As57867_002760 [Aphanomyces stellatus]VFT79957.1 Aste57867_2767 [Aphanomyces stellatus]